MAKFKRLTAEEAEVLFHAGVVMCFCANGSDDPELGMCNYSRELHGKAGTATPLEINRRQGADKDYYRWWVEVE